MGEEGIDRTEIGWNSVDKEGKKLPVKKGRTEGKLNESKELTIERQRRGKFQIKAYQNQRIRMKGGSPHRPGCERGGEARLSGEPMREKKHV